MSADAALIRTRRARTGERIARAWIAAYRRARRHRRRVPAGILGRARRLVVGWFDPLVTVELAPGRRLTLPFSHDLPFIRADHPDYADNLRRIVWALADRRGGVRLLDIGANVGDTAVLCHRPDVRIVAVEGLERYHTLCRANTAHLEGVTSVLATVGRPGDVLVYRQGRGTAATVSQPGPGDRPEPADRAHRAVDIPGVLELTGDPTPPDIVKVDTDGHDGEILLGGLDWFAAHRPVLFFEYDPALHRGSVRLPEVVGALVGIGYRWGLVYDEVGHLVVATGIDSVIGDLDRLLRRRGRGYWDVCLVADHELFADLVSRERGFDDVDGGSRPPIVSGEPVCAAS